MPRAVAMLICLAVFAAVWLVRARGGLQFLELRVYDFLLARRTLPAAESMSSRVAIVGVTELDIQNKVVQYPIADEEMASLLQKLLAYKPRAIGIDIFRDQLTPRTGSTSPQKPPPYKPRNLRFDILRDRLTLGTVMADSAQEQRDRFLRVMQDRSIINVMELPTPDDPVEVRAPEGVRRTQVGFSDFATDADERVRRAMLFTSVPDPNDPENREKDKHYQSLATRLALRYLREESPPIVPESIPGPSKDLVRLGLTTFRPFEADDGAYVGADDGSTQILMDFRGETRPPVIPVGQVLRGEVGADAFAGKVVLIGMTARSVKDLLRTPVDQKSYGVAVHAMVVEQLLRGALRGGAQVRSWSDPWENAWTLGWTLLGGLLALSVRVPWRFMAMLAGGIIVLTLVVVGVFADGLWLPLVPPLLGCLGAAGLVVQYVAHHERAERTVLNDLFERMVDRDVAETLWKRRDELLDEGHLAAREVRATLLFTDLEGFTTMTEAMDKSCLMAFLNDYMSVMSDVVGRTRDAFVNKYIGDAIMAVFGPPLERTAEQAKLDARHAVDCALEMRARLAEHHDRWERAIAEGIRRKLAADEAAGLAPPGTAAGAAAAAGARPGGVQLRMRIGVQSGMVTAGSLGSRQRLEYAIIGDTVNTAARLEAFDKDLMDEDLAAHGCRILIGQDTLDLLPPGEYLTRGVGSIKLKGKEQMVTIHGVVGRSALSPPPPNEGDVASAAAPPAAPAASVSATERPSETALAR